jgi:hypothetical protein
MSRRASGRAFGACLGLLASTLPVQSAEPPAATERFALLIGANDGGPDRVQLRYATSDAEDMASVLEELGGVRSADCVLLEDPSRAQVDRAFADLSRRMAQAKHSARRLELILYYSGHSDETGLLLRGERYGYDELRHALQALPVDVRIAILDSCSSGAVTREKGGVRRPPFLIDASAAVRGHAFLTSSSEHEAAQESDRLRASYFTHYLLSGLRGAADASADGRITLNEAYQFAFAETLRQTERTQAGPQHPAYDIQLQGTGDLVMTDLRATSASLTLGQDLAGRFFVHDADERLTAELYKPAGRAIELGLAPGTYWVRVDLPEGLYEAQVKLADGTHTVVSRDAFARVSREMTAMRGEAEAELDATGARGVTVASQAARLPAEHGSNNADEATAAGKKPRLVAFSLSLVPSVSTSPSDVAKRFSVNILMGESEELYGFELGFGLNQVTQTARGAQLSLGGNWVLGPMSGFQLALGANVVRGELSGMQGSLGMNYAGGGRLAQTAVGLNVSRGDFWGAQLSSGLNATAGRVTGAQAGLLNFGRGLDGVQLGLVNVTSKSSVLADRLQGAPDAGPQSGLADRGVQAALVNIGGDFKGVQVGLVNVAGKVDGVQVGLVNVSDDVDVPVGLLNIVRQGQLHLDFWTSTDEPCALGLRFGSRHFYTILVAGKLGRNFERTSSEDWYYGLGLGGHFTLSSAFVDLDAVSGIVRNDWTRDDGSVSLARLRLSVGWQIAPHLALYAGPTANVLIGVRRDLRSFVAQSPFAGQERVWHSGQTVVRLWPGIIAGVRL